MALGRRRGNDAPTSTGPTSGRESGQALLELALVTPILVLLILAIFQFAYVLETQVGLTNAVREAARRVATSPGPTTAWTVEQLMGDGGSNPGLLAQNIPGYSVTRVVSPSPRVRICSFDVDGETNYRADIEVTYEHPVFFGLLVYATDATDGTVDNRWTLTAVAQMRIEQSGSLDGGQVSGLCSAAWP